MTQRPEDPRCELLLMCAGAKGAIASTVAVAAAELQQKARSVLSSLTTTTMPPLAAQRLRLHLAGWDPMDGPLSAAVQHHGVVPAAVWQGHGAFLDALDIRRPPDGALPLADQVAAIAGDMRAFMARHPEARPVWVNLLPAACDPVFGPDTRSLDDLLRLPAAGLAPDLVYTLAALESGVPMVNFSPNTIELPPICAEAQRRGIPMAGRDGKTGQTYFKVVLASALKARALYVDGWYSLNILGNSDGRNLMDPERACGKLNNKTRLLDEILGYPVGERYDAPSHKVHIDYYPPRGDAKEAWDVIDFTGIFGLPMSLRLNLQGRDSILAAPMVIDLARWAAALKTAGVGGPVADLGFFFKKPVGEAPPLTFQEQLAALERLAATITAT